MDRSTPFGNDDIPENDDQIVVSSPRDSTMSDVEQASRRIEMLEEKLLEARGALAQSRSNNEKLTITIQQTRDQIAALRDEVEKLTQPPAVYGTFIDFNDDGTVDIFASGRKMRVALHPGLDPGQIDRGNEVVLNESFTVIGVRESDGQGEVVTVKEAPDTPCADVGGLDSQIEAITDAVELPYLHRALFNDYDLPAPKGILLYGPPGCGKTLIAKAVANSLSQKVAELTGNRNVRSYFLNIKGPELLNKYVGETERQIRVVFQRAREKAEEGVPVIIFFDEMDSLFRTRGTGISSDMESTIVPQLLAEIDGVESLRDVIVIGASNREALIDPAILRPGRLDGKIKIDRPNEEAPAPIFSRYPTTNPPLDGAEVGRLGGGDADKAVRLIIERTVEEMYRDDEANQFLEVTYQNGDKEIMYYKD